MDLSPDLESLVRDARVARLATVDARNRPHVVPVCFVYVDGVAYIVLDAKPKRVPVAGLRRVRNLLANPEVRLLIDRYEEDWSQLAYVQLRGRAGLIEAGPEQANAIARLRAKYPQYESMAPDNAPVIRIEVYDAVSWRAAQGDRGRPGTVG